MNMKTTSHVMPTYRRAPLQFVRGQGTWLETTQGEKYLDFAAGIGVSILGHGHPALLAALHEQAQSLWHTSNLFTIPAQEAVADKLCALSFAESVFFCNSGAEAVEGAIKAMRKYHASNKNESRQTIITFAGAFHGRTLATLAASNRAQAQDFGPVPEGFVQCAAFDLAEVAACIDAQTAGILLEPIQGEGGVSVAEPKFLAGLRALCDEHGILLALDEVQCGLGRTGALFAHEKAGITPDIMALAKGLGGGLPCGAVLASAAVGQVMQAGTHGSTFGGNPLAMAVAGTVLDIVARPDFLQHVQDVGLYLHQQLVGLMADYPDILLEIRGTGLMLGIQVQGASPDFVEALRGQKLLSVAAGNNVVRLLPPLNISQDEVRLALTAIRDACKIIKDESET